MRIQMLLQFPRFRRHAVPAWLFVTALAGGLLGGCSTLAPRLETPKLELLGIQMTSTGVRGLEYQIFLMGDSFAEGNSSDRFVVPAHGEAEFDMMVTTNFVSSLGRLISRVGGGKLENLDYEIAGQVLLDKGLVKKIPFNHHGRVDIAKALARKSGDI
jgi:hypothetical protein